MSDDNNTFNDAIRAEHASRQQAIADRFFPPPDPDVENTEGNPEGDQDDDR